MSAIKPFQIHPQLIEDCHLLGRLRFCFVLLQRNAAVPWFILVPETNVADLLDLPKDQRETAMQECANIGRFLQLEFGSPKLNFGALGNVVPQMHLHVIGRHPSDPCWPRPVWGNLPETQEYRSETVRLLIEKLATQYGLKSCQF